jgi:hypothetical protein
MWLRGLIIGIVASALAPLIACQGLSEGRESSPSAPSAVSDGQILYVVDNASVTTYAIDPGTLDPWAVSGSVGLISPSSDVQQFVPSPDGNFVYVLWSDAQMHEHLSSYATSATGVPQIPPLQVLNISSLSQLNPDPIGKFAYAMQLDDSNGAFTSTVFLFHVNASGMLQDPEVQGVYGPALIPTLLYGLSADGSELYLQSGDENGPTYWESAVNGQSGALATDVLLFQPPITNSVVFGASVIIDYQNALDCSQPRYVNVLSNQPEPAQVLIHCTSAMLSACGTASNVQLDPSGEYLFVTDSASQTVQVARINLSSKVVTDTGNSFPMTAQVPGFAFSPDGTIVYAWLASDSNLHVYGFDSSNGHLTEGGASIRMSNSAGFVPALRR